ncbi:MAG: hypothetical protein K5675_05035 [Lachnospiraceae bacterium]|nr:hypothetical protein [Lachnospiraceae bacterium]
MLNEKRVRHMTHMAMMEKKKLKDYGPVTNIAKSDFLSMNSLFAFLLGTVTYAVFYFLIIAILFNTVVTNINGLVLSLLLIVGVLGYLMYLYVYMSKAKKRAKKKYKRGRRALKERISDWDELERLYIDEEESKSPTIAMKDLQELHQLDNFEEEIFEEDEQEEMQIDNMEPDIVVKESVPESALERLMKEKNTRDNGD